MTALKDGSLRALVVVRSVEDILHVVGDFSSSSVSSDVRTRIQEREALLEVEGRAGGVIVRSIAASSLREPGFYRRWLERPSLDSNTWFHGLLVVVGATDARAVDPRRVKALTSNWPNAALAIVPVRVSPEGELKAEADADVTIPTEFQYAVFIEKAARHLCGWLEVIEDTVRICGVDVHVEPEQFRLLHALACHAQFDDGFVSRKQLPQLIDPTARVEPKAIDKRIQRLAAALEAAGYAEVLEIKPRRGLRLRWPRSQIKTRR